MNKADRMLREYRKEDLPETASPDPPTRIFSCLIKRISPLDGRHKAGRIVHVSKNEDQLCSYLGIFFRLDVLDKGAKIILLCFPRNFHKSQQVSESRANRAPSGHLFHNRKTIISVS